MKKLLCLAAASLILLLNAQGLQADVGGSAPKIRMVNVKTCIEHSKLGKQEQASFDALKKQMETVLGDKEKVLNDMAAKFEDADFLDSLTPEAETEMKRKFRGLTQEYTQLQQQYYQALQQANFKVMQKLTENITDAAKKVAQQTQVDLMLNEEACFYIAPGLDVSNNVIQVMDQQFDKEANKPKTEG